MQKCEHLNFYQELVLKKMTEVIETFYITFFYITG